MNFLRVMSIVKWTQSRDEFKTENGVPPPDVEPPPLICRACRIIDPTMEYSSLSDPDIASLFESCASMEVSESDGLPQNICADCLKKCSDYEDFRHMCFQSVAYFNEKRSEETEQGNTEAFIEANCAEEQIQILEDLDLLGDYQLEGIIDTASQSISTDEQMTVTSCPTVPDTATETATPLFDENDYPRFCTVCQRFFYTAELYNRYHGGREPEFPPIAKPLKDYGFRERNTRRERVKKEKKEPIRMRPKSRRELKSVCEICGEVVTKIDSHMTTHQPKTLECGLCKRKFVLQKDLLRHRKRHGQEKTVQCDQCPSVFYTESERKCHAKLIHPTELIECLPCGMQFKTRAYYKIHLLKHTDTRRFKCNHCDKRFFVNGHLKKHLLTHSNERPFKCTVCEAAFKSEKYLKTVHMLRMHKKK